VSAAASNGNASSNETDATNFSSFLQLVQHLEAHLGANTTSATLNVTNATLNATLNTSATTSATLNTSASAALNTSAPVTATKTAVLVEWAWKQLKTEYPNLQGIHCGNKYNRFLILRSSEIQIFQVVKCKFPKKLQGILREYSYEKRAYAR
jgi:hypothetical protein